MGKIKTVELTRAQRAAFEKGYRLGSSHAKKRGGRYKRIRKRPAKEPCPEGYKLKVECLGELERLSRLKLIDLY
jgi:hypothetical protein